MQTQACWHSRIPIINGFIYYRDYLLKRGPTQEHVGLRILRKLCKEVIEALVYDLQNRIDVWMEFFWTISLCDGNKMNQGFGKVEFSQKGLKGMRQKNKTFS